MFVSKNIFRDYDIRGVYPKDIDAVAANYIGKSLGTLLLGRKLRSVVVGRDDRESSPILSKGLIEGLLSTGVDVTFIDIALTPAIHFLTCTGGFDAGVVVTASHNPPDYNGFRIDYKNAAPFYGKDVMDLYDLIEKGIYTKGKGRYVEKNLSLDYLKFLKGKFSFGRKFKVIIDCGSGASSIVVPKLFNELGLEVVPVYCEYNANFPHGIPDPESPLFLEDLQKKVLENKADVGFGFDTDGDRFGVVDENGKVCPTDKALLLFAHDILSRNKGKKVVCDVKCSQLVEELVPSMGGSFEMLRTGHPYFAKKIVLGEAIVGAEYSGHLFFGEGYFGYDDGVYAACRVLDIMDRSGLKLSKLLEAFPERMSSPELKLDCPDNEKFAVIERVKSEISGKKQYLNVKVIDGVRANITPTCWFLIRASNTSPYLSIRFEGTSKDELNKAAEEVRKLLVVYKFVDLTNLIRFIG